MKHPTGNKVHHRWTLTPVLVNPTKQQYQQMDEKQGRRQLNNEQMDAILRMDAGLILAFDGLRFGEKFFRQAGELRNIKSAVNKAWRALKRSAHLISNKQIDDLNDTVGYDCRVEISSGEVDGMINIKKMYLSLIIQQATLNCALECTCTRQESKSCKLRQALVTVPGVKQYIKYHSSDAKMCPCMLMDIQEAMK